MLKKIHIENYKSLKNVDVPCAALNLLTGMNGAGKSSFIQVLRMLHLAAEQIGKLEQEICTTDFGGGCGMEDICYCYKSKMRAIKFSISYTDDSDKEFEVERILEESNYSGRRPGTVLLRHPDCSRIYSNAYGKAIHLEDMYTEDRGNVTRDEVRSAYATGDRIFKEEEERLCGVEHTAGFREMWRGTRFVDAFRRKPTDVHQGGSFGVYDDLSLLLGCVGDVKFFNPEGQNVMEFLYKCVCYGNEGHGIKLIDKISQCLNWVSPGARLCIEEKQVGGQCFYVSTVDYGVNGDVRMFKPQNVGFGVSYILPVLATLITAEKGNIIIIENPEAHLHPRGQAEIGKLIAETVSRGVQVFIETHSDHVINGIRVAVKKGVIKPSDVNIAFFERKEHAVVGDEGKESHEIFTTVRDIKVDENGSLSEYPEDFMDEWNNQLMRLMQVN